MRKKAALLGLSILLISIVAFLLVIWPGGCLGRQLIIADIKGPDQIDEYSLEEYSIEVTGDAGITYSWSVNPPGAGTFYNQTSKSTVFHPSGVTTDSQVEIRVEVDSDKNDPVTVTSTVIVLEKVVVVDDVFDVDTSQLSLVTIDEDKYWFDYEGTAPDIEPGTILVGSGEEAYLRKVVDIEDTGSHLIIETDQATLEDYIEEGHFSALLDFGAVDEDEIEDTQIGKPFCEILGYPAIEFPIGPIELLDHPNLSVKLTEGNIKFTPGMEIEMAFDPFQGMTYFYSAAKGRLEFDLGLRVEGTGHYELREEALVYSHPPAFFWVGPVFGAVFFDFYAGVDVNADIDSYIQSGFNTWTEVRLGAQYKDGNWSPVAEENHGGELTVIDGQATAELGLKGYIRPEVKVLFFGVVGPGINAEPYLELTGMGRALPPCLTYELSAGLTSDVFIRAEILGYRLADFSARLLDIKIPLASDSFGDCGSLEAGLIEGPIRIAEGTDVEFHINAGSDTGLEYHWYSDETGFGYFLDIFSPSTRFVAGQVSEDTPVSIFVKVQSDNSPPILRELTFLILDADLEPTVGPIIGPPVIYDVQQPTYRISVENDIGVTIYNWSCIPENAGTFDIPEAPFHAFFFPSETRDVNEATIMVEVNLENGETVERTLDVVILDRPDLTAGQIDGTSFLYENSSEIYCLTAGGDTGIIYEWSCIPPAAGTFENEESSCVGFTPSEVTANNEISLKVVVSSDNSEPLVRILDIVVKDSEDEPLLVSEIQGPRVLTVGSTGNFSVTASGPGEISYSWLSSSPEAGSFTTPTMANTGFIAGRIGAGAFVEITVEVLTENGKIETRILQIAVEPKGSLYQSMEPDGSGLIRTFIGHNGPVWTVAFSPDDRYILTGGSDSTMRLWDVNTGQEIRRFIGHEGTVYSVVFSPDGLYALSGSIDKTIKLWDLYSGREIRNYEGHSSVVKSVVFSPDGNYIISGSWGAPVIQWSIESGNQIMTFTDSGVNSVAVSPDGHHLLSGSYSRERGNQTLKLWDITTGEEIYSSSQILNIFSVVFSPDGESVIIGGSSSHPLQIWDVNTCTIIQSFENDACVYDVAISRDGQFILSGDSDNLMKLWNISAGCEVRSFAGHTDFVTDVDISPDDKYGLSGSRDGTVNLWDLGLGESELGYNGQLEQDEADDPGTMSLPQTVLSLSGYPWGNSAMSFLPQDAHEFRIQLFDGFAHNYAAICYTHYVTLHEINGSALRERTPSDGLLVGKIIDDNFQLLLNKRIDDRTDHVFSLGESEFGILNSVNRQVDTLFCIGWVIDLWDIEAPGFLNCYDLSTSAGTAIEVGWNAYSPTKGDDLPHDFEVLEDLNGVIVWEQSYNYNPCCCGEVSESLICVWQSLWTLNEAGNNTMVRQRGEYINLDIRDLPDEPPITWW